MKIIIAEHLGMCFGVRDALAQAERLAAEVPLTILGQLVHNPLVRERLQARGVAEGEIDRSATTKQVMITAHGASDLARQGWERAGFIVADGTCPLVRHAHQQLRLLVQRGYFPVVIGKRGHVEVRGLVGDFPHAVVIETPADFAEIPEPETRLGVISQTTQPIERVHEMIDALRDARPGAEVKFCDTVCQPTKNRQNALHKLIVACDIVVVVGGRNSNNTLQLAARVNAGGRRAIHIERVEELQRQSFIDAKCVGLTAGTSTLRETVDEVHARICEFAQISANG
jgi:4-hydroxy-3-methylbut-2-enyl diphosphate reductase